MSHADARVRRVVEAFEGLTPASLDGLGALYADDARFKDPFNEVQGLAPIRAIFAHMFVALDGARFRIRDVIVQGDQCFLSWEFTFRMKRLVGGEMCIQGATHLRFAADGRIAVHRDYWDAAEELYEKLPALGALMRWLKRRARS